MTIHPSVKILVVIFSLAVGSLMVWQLTRNLSGADEKADTEEAGTSTDEQPDIPIVSTKNPAGSIEMKDIFPSSKDQKKDEDKEKKQEPRPILPSSKSGLMLPPQK